MRVDELFSYLKGLNIELWVEGDRLRFRAPAGALTDALREELKAHRAEIIQRLATQPAADGQPAAISKTQPASTRSNAIATPGEDEIRRRVKGELARVLYLEPAEIDDTRPLTEYGLDSVLGVELVKNLNDEMHLNLRAIELYDYPNVAELSRFLHSLLASGGRPTESPAVFAPLAELGLALGTAAQLMHPPTAPATGPTVTAPTNTAERLPPEQPSQPPAPRPKIVLRSLAEPEALPPLEEPAAPGAPAAQPAAAFTQPADLCRGYVIRDATGGRAVLETFDLPDPGEHEVQIQVVASALNFADLLCVRGLYPTMPPYPFIPGYEVAGVVIKTGRSVTRFAAGDAVVGVTGEKLGGLAERLNTHERLVVRKPEGIGFAEASALPIAFVTAYHALYQVGHLQRGETVLIQTAAGGVGSMAVQLAKLRGAVIYGTSSSAEKRRSLTEMGVDQVLDYTHPRFTDEVLAMTGGRGVDVVLNTLAGDMIQKGIDILAPHGRYLELAVAGLKAARPLNLSRLVDNQSFHSIDLRRSLLSIARGERPVSDVEDYLAVMAEYATEGRIQPLVHAVLPSEALPQGLRLIEERKNIGKVVIEWSRNARDSAPRAARSAAPARLPSSLPVSSAATSSTSRQPAEEIAVVGMSGRFSGADSLAQFWHNLESGVDSVTSVPPERWDADAVYSADPRVPNTTYCRWGGFLNDVAGFDPLFFNISPTEAQLMDPQQRLFLEEAWRTIEDAGYDPQQLSGARCGVFVGVAQGEYGLQARNHPAGLSAHLLMGSTCSILPARVAYYLNLVGPAVAIDTSCSSSLIAVEQACQSILSGQCELALAGGVCVLTGPAMHIMTANAGMLSRQGRCQTFDNAADGFVPGEGAGAVLLKPFSRALADGDRIYGVIKGISANQDGRTIGMTAPSGKSQTALETDLYRRIGISPESITYVEAHGTGTKLGDPIEVEALTNAFRAFTDRRQFCAIGSVKTNIGHALTASGIASLIKVLLCLSHQRLVPSLHFEQENEHLKLDEGPFFVNVEARPWEVPAGTPRRAAISAFGFSGTNCHLVVEESPQAPLAQMSAQLRGATLRPRLVFLSARSPEALQRKMADLLAWLPANREQYTLADIAYSHLVSRTHFKQRAAFVARDTAELIQLLAAAVRQQPADGFVAGGGDAPGMAAMFMEVGRRLLADVRDKGQEHDAAQVAGEDAPERDRLLALAELYVKGFELPWHELYAAEKLRRAPLPLYPFDHKRYWVEAPRPEHTTPVRAVPPPEGGPVAEAVSQSHGTVASTPPDLSYYVPRWVPLGRGAASRRSVTRGVAPPLPRERERVLVVAPIKDFGWVEALRRTHSNDALTVIRLGDDARERGAGEYEIAMRDPGALLQVMSRAGTLPARTKGGTADGLHRIYFLGGLQGDGSDAYDLAALEESQQQGVLSFFRLIKACHVLGLDRAALRLEIVTSNVIALEPGEQACPHMAPVHGLARSLAKEYPHWQVRCVDVRLPAGDSDGTNALEQLAEALTAGGDDGRGLAGGLQGDVLAFRQGRFYEEDIRPLVLPARAGSPFRAHGVYLILGGAGGIGLALSLHLARTVKARLVLVGRSELKQEQRDQIRRIEDAGGEVLYAQADATVPGSLRTAVEQAKARFGRIHGVFHSAVVLRDSSLANMDETAFRAALDPKVMGTVALHDALRGDELDFLAHFSSVQSFTGNPGQGNYAAGSCFQDAFALWAAEHEPYPVKVLNWGYWGSVGVVSDAFHRRRAEALGAHSIEPEEGMAAIKQFLGIGHGLSQMIALKMNPQWVALAGIDVEHPVRLQPADVGSQYKHVMQSTEQALLHEGAPFELAAVSKLQSALDELERFGAAAVESILAELDPAWAGGRSYEHHTWSAQLGVPEPQHRRFDALVAALVQEGVLRLSATGETVTVIRAREGGWPALEGEKARLEARYPELAPYLALLWRCIRAYPEVLRGEVEGTHVLFAEGSLELVEKVYGGNVVADLANELLAQGVLAYVEGALPALPDGQRLKVLEIGAGTGGTSHRVLRKLTPYADRLEYHYTDISVAFTKHGARTFGPHYSFVTFGQLDVEQPVAGQGYVPGTYDLVLAGNVLHATQNIRQTVGHARSLLKQNGLLLLNEGVRVTIFGTLTFGLLDGWWRYEDMGERLPDAPLLSERMWKRVLWEDGFRRVGVPAAATLDFLRLPQRVIVAESDGLVPWASLPAPRGGEATSRPTSPRTKDQSGPSVPPAGSGAAKNGATSTRFASRAEEENYRAFVTDTILDTVSEVLQIDRHELDPQVPYVEYGVDSILGIQLIDRLRDRLGVDLRPTDLFSFTTIDRLVDYLVTEAPRAATPDRLQMVEPGPEAESHDLGLIPGTNGRSASTPAVPGGPELARGAVLPPPRPPARAPLDAPTQRGAGQRGFTEIAIVGMSGCFPDAANPEEYWRNLAAGRNCVREVPAQRWDVAAYFDPDPKTPSKTYSKWGGYIADADKFDPLFFNISPREAEVMDPQQRLFLQEAWRALEDAGYSDRGLRGARCGVFVGCNLGDYHERLRDQAGISQSYAFMGNSNSILASRIAYYLDLKGPAVSIDTACSSSLVALDLACQSIWNGTSDFAVAGGVTILSGPAFHVLASKTGMLSPDGSCRVFDNAANGFVPGEGVGAVVLKPLAAALADGNPIYAVIRGIGTNQDGKTNGITAPSVLSQTALLSEVYDRFGIDPATIGYVEAHGTGTRLGDPIEWEALTKAFRRYTSARGYCGIGSVKSNIGHTLAASGIAGLLKILLAFRHRQLPPGLHFSQPNELIDLENSPFYVNTELRPWIPAAGMPLRAAINSFGFSGTNAHLVVDDGRGWQQDAPGSDTADSPGYMVTLSARSEGALRRKVADLLGWLEQAEGVRLRDIAYTLHHGRSHFHLRAAWVVRDLAELRESLRALHEGTAPVGCQRANLQEEGVRLTAALRVFGNRLFDETIHAQKAEEYRENLGALADLYTRGLEAEWAALYAGQGCRFLSLPTYPFERESYWITPTAPPRPGGNGQAAATAPLVSAGAASAVTCYRAEWQEIQSAVGAASVKLPPRLVVFADDTALAEALRSQLPTGNAESAGEAPRVVTVRAGGEFRQPTEDVYEIRPGVADDYSRLWHALAERGLRPDVLIHAWNVSRSTLQDESTPDIQALAGRLDAEMATGVSSIFHLARSLVSLRPPIRRILFMYAAEGPAPVLSAAGGYARSLEFILPTTRFSLLASDDRDPARLAAAIATALNGGPAYDRAELRLRDGRWEARAVIPWAGEDSASPNLRSGGVCLITGGSGKLGLILARYLAEHYRARIALVARSAPSPAVRDTIAQCAALGADVRYFQADVADPAQMAAVVLAVREAFGAIRGVIHAAGTTHPVPLTDKSFEQFAAVLRPKVVGTVILDALTAEDPLDFFVTFSSLSAWAGDLGACDYSVGCRFQDAFMELRETRRKAGVRQGHSISINWPLWREGGMHFGDEHEALYLKAAGLDYLETAQGLTVFARALSESIAPLIVLAGGPDAVDGVLGRSNRHGEKAAEAPTAAQGKLPARLHPSPSPVMIGDDGALARRVEDDLAARVAHLLKLPREKVVSTENLGYFGFDSIILKSFSDELADTFEIDFTPAVFFSHSTIRSLSEYLAHEHADAIRRYYAAGPAPHAGNGQAAAVSAPPEVAPAPPDDLPASETPARSADDTEPYTGAIAIIGMHCVFPGSADADAFWDNLRAQKDLITEVPASRWAWQDYYGDPNIEPNKALSKWGGFIEDVDAFDAAFFRITPHEAVLMDPQQRQFLETAWKAVEDAGYRPSDFAGRSVGVFAGVQFSDYQYLLAERGVLEPHVGTGNAHAILPNRVSYLFDWRGPSESIDTACSSSLVAIHRAVRALRSGECELAIAGGVSLLLSPYNMVGTGILGVLAPDGKCKTFDKSANGYVKGEGVGAVFLKPLAQAIRDRDAIRAVIRGTAVNHGGRAASLTAPNAEAQADVIVAALRDAGIAAESVTYVETHGTGTELGDPVEIEGLKTAFRRMAGQPSDALRRSTVHRCGLGTVKTNIGHLEPAAGIAGIAKVILALQHGELPGNLHFKQLNPYIRLHKSPFYIVAETQPWERLPDQEGRPLPRRAGVSSFGFGGANAHVILEEWAEERDTSGAGDGGEPVLVVLSARTPERLRAYAERLLLFVRRQLVTPPALRHRLQDIAFTLQVGREPLAERLAFVAHSLEEMQAHLRAFTEEGVIPTGATGPQPNAQLLEAAAAQWLQGAPVDWRRLPSSAGARRVPLPTYPFARDRFWVDRKKPAPGGDGNKLLSGLDGEQAAPDTSASAPDETLFASLAWKPAEIEPDARPAGPILLLETGTEIGQALRALAAHPAGEGESAPTLISVRPGAQFGATDDLGYEVRPGNAEDMARLLAALEARRLLPRHIVHAWPVGLDLAAIGSMAEMLEQGIYTVTAFCRSLARLPSVPELDWITVVTTTGLPDPRWAGLAGAYACIRQENPQWRFRLVTMTAPALPVSDREVGALLWRELSARGDNLSVRYEGSQRLAQLVQEWTPQEHAETDLPWRDGGTYLITGGAGGLGLTLARWIAQTTHTVNLVLCGRSDLDEARRARVAELESLGANVLYQSTDLAVAEQVEALSAAARAHFGQIDGVFHLAGAVNDRLIGNKTRAEMAEVLGPKVQGTMYLDQATRDDNLAFFVMFSSLSSVLGNAGQADYGFANGFMDAFAVERDARCAVGKRRGRTLVLNWPHWQDGGMHIDRAGLELMRARSGLASLSLADGQAALRRIMAGDSPAQVMILHGEQARMRELLASHTTGAAIYRVDPALGSGLPRDLSAAALAAFLKEKLEQISAIPQDEFDAETEFQDLGIDSILAMKILAAVERDLGLRLYPNELIENNTIARLAAYLSRELTATAPAPAAPRQKPLVFILSTPRAGSTLLRAMLMGHPQLFAPPELHLLPFSDMRERRDILAAGNQNYLNEGLTAAVARLAGLSVEEAVARVRSWEEDALPVTDVYRQLQAWAGDRILVDKSPSYGSDAMILARAEALEQPTFYIHLVRHPLAMMESFVRNRFDRLIGLPGDAWENAEQLWLRFNQNITAFLQTVPPARVVQVRYEELVRSPEAVMRSLCTRLDVPFDEGMLQPYAGDRMLEGLHPVSMPIGDPNFMRHQEIEAELADAWKSAVARAPKLTPDTIAVAAQLGYSLGQTEDIGLAPSQAAFLARYAASPQWHIEQTLSFRPGIKPDAALVEAALQRLVERHAALRHGFVREQARWVQREVTGARIHVAFEDLSTLSEDERQDRLAVIKEELHAGLDISRAPLLAARLVRVEDAAVRLILVVHHLVADGVSMARLLRDFEALLFDRADVEPAADRRFAGYIAKVEALHHSTSLDDELPFWQAQVAGGPVILPVDNAGGANTIQVEAESRQSFDVQAWFKEPRAARFQPFALLSTALYRCLATRSSCDTPALAFRVHRRNPGLGVPYDDVVGWFAGDFPLRLDMAADVPGGELLRQFRALYDSVPRGGLGYELLAAAGRLPPVEAVSPVRLNFQPLLPDSTRFTVESGLYEAPAHARPYELDLIVRYGEERLTVIARYSRERFYAESIAAFVGSWQEAVQRLVDETRERAGQ